MKTILSFFLAAIMLVSLLPSALAAGQLKDKTGPELTDAEIAFNTSNAVWHKFCRKDFAVSIRG